MTQHPSHPSPPWPGARKPRAVPPRTRQDYNLMAATVALDGPAWFVSHLLGYDESYADQLLRSGPGVAFVDWFRCQPEEFKKRFIPEPDAPPDTDEDAERIPAPGVTPPQREYPTKQVMEYFREPS